MTRRDIVAQQAATNKQRETVENRFVSWFSRGEFSVLVVFVFLARTLNLSCPIHIQKGSDWGQILSKAAERAHYFMSWAPPYCDAPEPTHIKKYMICKISITGVGYMYLTENKILQKGDGTDPFRPGYYRWHGPMHKRLEGKDHSSGTEYLICFFEEEYSEIV